MRFKNKEDMKQSEWNRYYELRDSISDALDDYFSFEDVRDLPDVYRIAVNPKTYEVVVVGDEQETPEGWIYEELASSDEDEVDRCAQQYFDFRS